MEIGNGVGTRANGHSTTSFLIREIDYYLDNSEVGRLSRTGLEWALTRIEDIFKSGSDDLILRAIYIELVLR